MLNRMTYFFPGVMNLESGAPGELLERIKAGPYMTSSANAIGPQGRGILAVRGDNMFELPVYQPETQRWVKVAAAGYWIGLKKEGCCPADFERPKKMPGTMVHINDGEWLIPCGRLGSQICGIPWVVVRNEYGEWIRHPREKWAWFAELAEAWSCRLRRSLLEGIFEGEEEELTIDLAKIISVNYDLSFDEIEVLGLFDPGAFLSVFQAFTDFQALMGEIFDALQKRSVRSQGIQIFTKESNDESSIADLPG
jgi:hypothetical protein